MSALPCLNQRALMLRARAEARLFKAALAHAVDPSDEDLADELTRASIAYAESQQDSPPAMSLSAKAADALMRLDARGRFTLKMLEDESSSAIAELVAAGLVNRTTSGRTSISAAGRQEAERRRESP